MKVIIAGSRGITDPCVVLDALLESGFEVTEVVSGAARGVDRLGELIATACQIPVALFEPDYIMFGRNAPLKRNLEMAQYADALVAVWDGASSGTAHMISKAYENSCLVFVKVVDK